jgi:hypothetical protein
MSKTTNKELDRRKKALQSILKNLKKIGKIISGSKKGAKKESSKKTKTIVAITGERG